MPQSTLERTAAYRERQRARGLKPVTRWVLDVNNPDVQAAIQRDIAVINAARHRKSETETMDMVEGWLAETEGWV
jgi:hypothetical protein